MSRHDTIDFLERYRAASDRLDGDAVADLWQLPCAIAQGDAVTAWSDDASMRDNMRRLCEVYRAAGYARAEFELIDHVALGETAAFANVRWTLRRAEGSLLQGFHTGYNLLRRGDAVRVLLCTAYEEDLAEMKPHAAQ